MRIEKTSPRFAKQADQGRYVKSGVVEDSPVAGLYDPLTAVQACRGDGGTVGSSQAKYWDDVLESWRRAGGDRVWRAHSDAVNSLLLDAWLPKELVERLLKTDLFDEAISEGLAPRLLSSAEETCGVDVSTHVVQRALEKYPSLVGTVADVRALPFPDSSFDVIVSLSTLDHFERLEQLERSLEELHRVLRVGGRLILTLDNPLNPFVALRGALPFPWLIKSGVVPYAVGANCGPAALRQRVESAGFTVTDESSLLHCPRVIAVYASRWISRVGWNWGERVFLKSLMAFESLRRSPLRYRTGHFSAVLAYRS